MNASMNDRKKAVLLAAVLLVIAILCGIRIYAVSHSSTGNGQALYADIYQSGELLETIRLDTVTDEYTFEVPGANGASNTVCVRPGSIAIISANWSGSDLCASGIYQHLSASHHLSAQPAGDPGKGRGCLFG